MDLPEWPSAWRQSFRVGSLHTFPPRSPCGPSRHSSRHGMSLHYPTDLFAVHRVFDLPAVIWILRDADRRRGNSLAPFRADGRGHESPPSDVAMENDPAFPMDVDRPRRLPLHYGDRVLALASAAKPIELVFWPFLAGNVTCRGQHCFWAAGFCPGFSPPSPPERIVVLHRDSFTAETSWWDCGFHFGSIHWPYLVTGANQQSARDFPNSIRMGPGCRSNRLRPAGPGSRTLAELLSR